MRRMGALALTMGEPSGIGGEIAVGAWRALRAAGGPAFALLDDADRLARGGAPIRRIDAPEGATAVFRDALPVLHRPLPRPAVPGRPDGANAPAVIASIDEAVALAKAGRVTGVVTNPIQKSALYAAGFAHPGHTEYLAQLAGTGVPPVMLLACPELRVVPVTLHEPLARAIARLTPGLIVEAARTAAAALRRDFGVEAPRPAVAALRAEGIDARGPLSPDTMFTARARPGYDVAICLYHDQALIPIKTLD